MKNKFSLTLFCLFTSIAFSQTSITPLWENRLALIGDNSDRYNKIISDGSGNYILVGYTEDNGNYKDYLTVKMDANGDTLWRRTKNKGADDEATCVAVDASGNIYVTGYADGGNTKNDIYTIKYDANGVDIWDTAYNNTATAFMDEFPVAIAVDFNGDIVITGWSEQGTWISNQEDIVTLKYNNNGGLIWSRLYSGVGLGKDEPAGLSIDATGNIFIAGRTFNTDDDGILLKYDPNGNILCTKIYNSGFGDDRWAGIALDPAGNPVVTGRVNNGSDDDYRTIKYTSSACAISWSKAYVGSFDDDRGNAIAIDAAGNVYVTGQSVITLVPVKTYQVATVKYNGSGVQQWLRLWQNTTGGDAMGEVIRVDAAGNVYVMGTMDENAAGSPTANNDYLTLKYDATPNLIYAKVLDGTAHTDDKADDMIVDASGNAIVTGRCENLITQRDGVTIKYDAIGNPTWTKVHNGVGDFNQSGHAMVVDPNGNSYVAGYTFANQNNRDALLTAIDVSGNTLWTKTFSGVKLDDDEYSAIAYDGSGTGAVIACGYTKVSGEKSDFLIRKYDLLFGDTLWTRTYGDTTADQADKAVSLAVDAAGNVYVTGYSDKDANDTIDDRDIVTIKYNSLGVQQWMQTYNGPSTTPLHHRDEPAKLILDHAGNVVVAGRTEKSNDDDMVILKYDPSTGNPVTGFPVLINGFATNDDRAADVAVDNSDNIYVTGYSQDGNLNGEDYITSKYSSTGTYQWTNFYDNGSVSQVDNGNAIALDASGNVYVTGKSDFDVDPLVSNYDYQTIKYDNAGTFLNWNSPVGEYAGAAANDDVPVAIAVDASGNIYVTGQAGEGTALAQNKDCFTIGYYPNGTVRFTADYDGPAGLSDAANAMVVNMPVMWIAGSSEGANNSQKDVLTLKYDATTGLNPASKGDGNLSVYPNPLTTSATVHLSAAIASNKNLSLKMYDVLGNVVMEKNNISGSSFKISRGNLSAGIYMLRLFDGADAVADSKVVVN